MNIETVENQKANSQADLTILEHIERDPDTTQASLAEKIGVAVGTINWHLKRLIAKGYVKVKRLERKKLRYIITPEGLTLRARLLVDFIQSSMEMYRLIRERSQKVVIAVKDKGVEAVQIIGNDEVAEILRLTCMEHGLAVREDPTIPILEIVGLKIFVRRGFQ